MDLVKAIFITTQAHVDALLAADPEHWVGEAVDEGGIKVGDFKDTAVPCYKDNDAEVAHYSELLNNKRVIDMGSTHLAVYIAGRLYNGVIEVPWFKFEGDEDGVVWFTYLDSLNDNGEL